ncbi:hypothetical protein PMIN07_007730 [Paraphaeosphaeria minitans]
MSTHNSHLQARTTATTPNGAPKCPSPIHRIGRSRVLCSVPATSGSPPSQLDLRSRADPSTHPIPSLSPRPGTDDRRSTTDSLNK